MKPTLPPLDGSLATLLDFADFQALHNPLSPWLIYPTDSSNGHLGSVCFGEVVASSHQIASILRPERSGLDNEVVVLLLHTDNVIYASAFLGVLRAGYIPFPVSPRNSVDGVCHMLQSTGCRRLLVNAPTAELASHVKARLLPDDTGLQLNDLERFHDIHSALLSGQLISGNTPPYPAPAQEIDMDLPMFYLHSSGSTGLPKAIPIACRLLLQNLRRNIFGMKRGDTRFGAIGLPTFHSMGLLLQILYPLGTSHPATVMTPQYPAPPLVPNAKFVLEVCKISGCQGLVAPPSFIESWSHSQDDIDYLRTLTVLMFGGGPLSIPVGDKMVAHGVPLICGYGGTEFGNPTASWDEVPPEQLKYNPNWAWMQFPAWVHTEWVSQGDGTYELTIHDTDEYKVRVSNIPGKNAYATGDLFVPHPTISGLWRIVGRKDDVITLSTGEKIVPVAQEGRINASPLVSGCVMFGRGQEQAGLLVEVAADHAFDPRDESVLAEFRNKLWPIVEEANQASPAFGRIYKEMVIITDPSNPLPRSGKNTIVRKQALALYAQGIDALYTSIKESIATRSVLLPDSWKGEDLRVWLQSEACTLLGKEVLREVDLFHQGLDSLGATFLRNRIIGALRASTDQSARHVSRHVPSSLIFDYPTIEALAKLVSSLIRSSTAPAFLNAPRIQVEDINSFILKYSLDLPPKVSTVTEAPQLPVVLLTGATGNIGSHILAALLGNPHITRVYTLDRPSADPRARLRCAFVDRLLPIYLLESPRLVCLGGTLAEDYFGLQKNIYDELLHSVTHVLHNAWTVNFNLPLHAFDDQIAGVRRLIEASASAPQPLRLLVTSSIGVTMRWNPIRGSIPEKALNDPSVATSNGYTASKYIVEDLLRTAAEKGHSVMCVRMGQVCGPQTTGAWSMSEWIPMMLKSSIALGCLPILFGPVAWVPMDAIGQAYVEWITTLETLPFLVNVVHPRPTPWDLVFKHVRDALAVDLQSVPLHEWAIRLEERAASASSEEMAQIPAIKLVGFFRRMASSNDHRDDGQPKLYRTYETRELMQSSPTMRSLAPLSAGYACAWTQYWAMENHATEVLRSNL